MPRGTVARVAARCLGSPGGAGPRVPLLAAWEPLGCALLAQRAAAVGPEAAAVLPLMFWSNLRPQRPEALPASLFFRPPSEMPAIERRALELCRLRGGRVLDVGAGAGSHALALAEAGVTAEAVDVCGAAVEVMLGRGVAARQASLWDLGKGQALQAFDTILFLMNSAGVVGSMARLQDLLRLLHRGTRPGCRVLLDVSPPEWPAVLAAAQRRSEALARESFAEKEWVVLQCWLTFGEVCGEAFPLLFAEARAVAAAAAAVGWQATLVAEDAESRHALLELKKDTPAGVAGAHVVSQRRPQQKTKV